ncbi:MAG: YkvA family protein [Candidatus Tectimicrobiota bacterium]
MADPQTTPPNVDEIFSRSQWKEQAEHPGALEKIGQQWDKTLATKGQALRTYLEELQLAYKMLRDPNFQLERSKKITLIIALLYIISPIDLIPDALPFVGLLDDVLVAGYALKQVAAELERYKQSMPKS